jgi:hypothetical protein
MLSQQEIKLANEYMNYLFNSKEPVKARTRDVLIWEEESHVNWLAFNLAMFKYFDTDEFSEEQRQLIKNFQKSVEGKDGHNPYYDYYGNTLKNMHGTLEKFNT